MNYYFLLRDISDLRYLTEEVSVVDLQMNPPVQLAETASINENAALAIFPRRAENPDSRR